MLERFLNYINEEHLYAQGQQVLLAVSGGRDSVVLVNLMERASIPFAIAHCNFHLRPDDCDRDEQFVRRLAVQCKVPVYVAEFDTQTYAAQQGLSIEEAARNLRYDFFEQVRLSNGYDLIATAHHRDDAVETFFINLLRGTGISGLHGILSHNGHIIRPLLCFGRDDINRYIQKHQLSFVEDVTNSQPLYLRNRIRHQLIPLMQRLSPSFMDTMQDNMHRLGDAEQLYLQAVAEMRQQLLRQREDGFAIPINELKQREPLSTCLFELLRPFDFSAAQCREVMKVLDGQSGQQFFSSTYRLLHDRDYLLISRREENPENNTYTLHDADLLQKGRLLLQLSSSKLTCDVGSYQLSGVPIRLKPNQAWFDFDKLHFPLFLRHWRQGDRFIPFGMKGGKLLSDLFSDMKLSRWDKECIWLLCDADNQVLWVVGIRAAAHAMVDTDTHRILKFQVE